MLGRRLISAAIIITVMVLLLWLDFWLGTDSVLGRPGLVLCLIGLATAAMAASELAEMFNNVANSITPRVAVGATIVMTCVAFAPALWKNYPVDCPMGKFGWSLAGIILAMVIVFLLEMQKFDSTVSTAKGEVIDRLGRYSLVFVYLSMLFGFLVPHRQLQGSNGLGLLSVVALISTVKLSDSFAYFIGKRFGTVKLAPKLSPGKTVQGAFGALLGGCVAIAIIVYLVAPYIFGITVEKPWWWFLLYGIVVTCAGMVGDLAESLIKRDANTKDSSRWLPGLGGVLDILDSMVFAAPVSYFLWIVADLPTQTGQ